MSETERYDAVVIGAGISGVIFMAYARARGLRCIAFEKQSDVGGLWNRLPEWQDIQNRKEDFAINGVPLEGVRQPDIHEHVRAWVERYDLAPFIRLGCEVESVSREDGSWHVRTSEGSLRADYVIAATGVQNEPWIPDVHRLESEVVEKHSSALREPEELAGRRVTVVGGGTSAWDMLDLAIQNEASRIHWVHRSIKWFQPTSRGKQNLWPNLRELGVLQVLSLSMGKISAFTGWVLRKLFAHYEISDLQPDEPFDFNKHQLVPGRSRMLQHLDVLEEHRGEVADIQGRRVRLDNGERFETDVLLWGTGYRMNLEYLDLPEYRSIRRLDELRPRLGSLIRSTDYPSLFFLSMSLTNSTASTPLFAAVEARSVVAHILGECDIPTTNVPHQISHWNVHRFFAGFDRSNYPRAWWRVKHFLLAWWYEIFRNKSFRV
jgi:hypothetical protein